MRILCLDIGTKRTGVAVSDPLGMIAQPVKVIKHADGSLDLVEIAKLCKEYKPGLILVGLPLNEESEMGPQAIKIKKSADRIEKYLKKEGISIPFEMWDERYSTKIAEERLIEANVSRKKRRKVVDKMAAVTILEDYLSRNLPENTPTGSY